MSTEIASDYCVEDWVPLFYPLRLYPRDVYVRKCRVGRIWSVGGGGGVGGVGLFSIESNSERSTTLVWGFVFCGFFFGFFTSVTLTLQGHWLTGQCLLACRCTAHLWCDVHVL